MRHSRAIQGCTAASILGRGVHDEASRDYGGSPILNTSSPRLDGKEQEKVGTKELESSRLSADHGELQIHVTHVASPAVDTDGCAERLQGCGGNFLDR